MASGYTNTHPRDSGSFYFETRFYWESSYNAATNTSTVSFRPQIYTNINMGNDLRMFNYSNNDSGVYRDESKIYSFSTDYGSGNYLRTWSNPHESWVGLFEQGDGFPSLTVKHDNSGNASIKLGLRGTVISLYDSSRAYSSWIDDGYYINLSESRSLHVSYNANGGSGAPGATYFYGSTESIKLSSTIPTRTGYTFLGWSTSSTATTATYSAGQNIGTRSSNLVLYAVWKLNTYTLHISQGAGSQITVEKQGTVLSDGSTITQGDTLIVKVSPMIGYDIAGLTVNGIAITSGDSYKVSSDVTVESSATVKQFSLTKSEGTGTIITVTRTYSPLGKAALEELSDGSTLYHSDVISIAVLTTAGYILQTATMNGGSVQTPYSVSDNVVLTATAIAAGAYIRGNSSFDMYQMLIKSQQAWDLYRPVVYNGASWENY